MAMPDIEKYLRYDKPSGFFFWRESVNSNGYSGKRAGHQNERGYRQITLLGVNYLEHRLVAELYLPKEEGRDHINHINGVKFDNRVCNLEWCSPKENVIHAYKTGLAKGKPFDGNPNAKITKKDAIFCIKNYKPRDRLFGARALAKRFGVDKSTICLILKGVNWKGVTL